MQTIRKNRLKTYPLFIASEKNGERNQLTPPNKCHPLGMTECKVFRFKTSIQEWNINFKSIILVPT